MNPNQSLEGACAVQDSMAADSSEELPCSRIAFVVAVILLGLIFLCPIAYGANDDSGVILSLANPTDPSSKHPLLVTLAPSFAVLLSKLYLQYPSVPWYGISLAVANWVAATVFLRAVMHLKIPVAARLICVPAFAVLFFDALFFWTFTKAMLLLQFAAFINVLGYQMGYYRGKIPVVATILLLMGGYAFRSHFFYNTLAFAWPVLLFVRLVDIPRLAVIAVVVAGLLGADHLYRQQLERNDADYQSYNAFHNTRYKFHDMPVGRESSMIDQALADAGWSKEDMKFYGDWNIYDDKQFHVESIKRFLSTNEKGLSLIKTIEKPTESPWLKVFGTTLFKTAPYMLVTIPAFIGLCMMVVATRNSVGNLAWYKSILAILGTLALLVYLAFNRLPIRLCVPILTYLLTVCLLAVGYLWVWKRDLKGGFHFEPPLLVGSVLALGLFVFDTCQMLVHYRQANQSFTDFTKLVRDKSLADQVLIPINPATGFSPEMNHPLFAEGNFDRGLIVVPVGTKVNSPLYKQFLERYGIRNGHDLLTKAADGKVLFFSFEDKPETLDLWLKYMNKHFSKSADEQFMFESLVEDVSKQMAILKLTKRDHAANSR